MKKREPVFKNYQESTPFQDFFGTLTFPIQMLLSDGTIVG